MSFFIVVLNQTFQNLSLFCFRIRPQISALPSDPAHASRDAQLRDGDAELRHDSGLGRHLGRVHDRADGKGSESGRTLRFPHEISAEGLLQVGLEQKKITGV